MSNRESRKYPHFALVWKLQVHRARVETRQFIWKHLMKHRYIVWSPRCPPSASAPLLEAFGCFGSGQQPLKSLRRSSCTQMKRHPNDFCKKSTTCEVLKYNTCLGSPLPYTHTSLILAEDSETQEEAFEKLAMWSGKLLFYYVIHINAFFSPLGTIKLI